MTQFIFSSVLGNNSRSIPAAYNHDCTILGSLDICIEKGLGALSKSWKFKDTWGTKRILTLNGEIRELRYEPVPKNCLSLQNCGAKQLTTLRASIKTHPVIRDALSVNSTASLRSSHASVLWQKK